MKGPKDKGKKKPKLGRGGKAGERLRQFELARGLEPRGRKPGAGKTRTTDAEERDTDAKS